MKKKIFYFILAILVVGFSMYCIKTNYAQQNNTTAWVGKEKWIEGKPNVLLHSLSCIVTVTVKNNANRPYYFKISQRYTAEGRLNGEIKWVIVDTYPKADKMIRTSYPDLGGDYGWRIGPKETKTVTFVLAAKGPFGEKGSCILPEGMLPSNAYWPLVSEPGLYTSWFMPEELESLNPDLQIVGWRGTFFFKAENMVDEAVSGIIRAPIVPINSKLVCSDPPALIDKSSLPGSEIAYWDVKFYPEETKSFTYTYKWTGSKTTVGAFKEVTQAYQYRAPISNKTYPGQTTVPTKETGAPLAPLLLGALAIATGAIYAKFFRP